MRVLVTGATGLLGGRLVPHLRAAGFETVAHGMARPADVNADLRDPDAAHALLDDVTPDAIVHCVALTDVDACEEDPGRAREINVRPLENVTAWLANHPGRRLVHLSSDQLYDGPGAHQEDDVSPRNEYARTKLQSEAVAREANAIVLRTNFFGRSETPGRPSFSDWLIDAFRGRKPITLFTDVFFSPLALPTLINIIEVVLRSDATGVFNVGSRHGMSKRDFAHALATHLGLIADAARDGVSINANLPAPRPTGMLMDSAHFEDTFNMRLPTLQDEIEKAEA